VRRDGETTVESTGWRTQERQWRDYDDDKHWGVLVEIIGFLPEMRDSLEAASDEYLGQAYGFLALLRHGLDGLCSKLFGSDKFWFRNAARGHPLKYNICSWFTTFTHCKAGWLFEGPDGKPLNPGRATPDDVMDDVFERRQELYRIAAEFGTRPRNLPASYCHKIDTDLEP